MKTLLLFAALFLMSGCVHDISVAPELATINKVRPVTIERSVAYYIPPELYALSVTTPGGNNDKLRYSPYKESEAALRKVLENVFTEVHRIDSLDDEKIEKYRIDFIFVPQIDTISFSNSAVDWQPTKFGFILDVTFLTADRKAFYTSHAEGKGVTNFGRYQENPSYAAEVASRSAFLQFQDEIIDQRLLFK